MCTYLDTPDVKILVDAGLSLGPRFGMLPHPEEYKLIYEKRKLLKKVAEKSDIITVSHYHHDHYTPSYKDTVFICSDKDEFINIYQDKQILLKDIHEKINSSQRRRGWIFQRSLDKIAKSLEIADACSFEFGETNLKFSDPVSHGEDNSILGWVIMMSVENDGSKVIHSSDVQGPSSDKALKWLLNERPNLLILSGPPTYMKSYIEKRDLYSTAFRNMKRLIENIPVIIMDHHIIRATDWEGEIAPLRECADNLEKQVLTAAELSKIDNNALEAKRMTLYEELPPNNEFMKWTKLPWGKRGRALPPIK